MIDGWEEELAPSGLGPPELAPSGLAPLFTYSAGATCALGRILLPSKGNFTFDSGLHTASLIQGDSKLTASIVFGSSKVVMVVPLIVHEAMPQIVTLATQDETFSW